LKLNRSINNLAKRLDKFDPVFPSSNKTGLNYWKGKAIIPFADWMRIKDTQYALQYFPDDFDEMWTCISQEELERGLKREDAKIWNSDYLELMEYSKNANYGKLKCFHCLLSPDGNDPIFIGINRLVAKGLNNGTLQGERIHYPCLVVNRFQCPFKRNAASGIDIPFNVDDLFRLHKLAFAAEISLAKARKDNSEIMIKNKEELLHALTNKETFGKILDQGAEASEVSEYIKNYLRENRTYILDYFMRIKDLVNAEELRFY
jgi:hypothetical protein